MKRHTPKPRSLIRHSAVSTTHSPTRHEPAFREIITLIQQARQQAFRAVNVGLIDLYWTVGERISRRIASDGWGKSTIVSLAAYIRRRDPNARGFSSQNLWRMRQFYETWHDEKKLSPLVRELSWTNNLLNTGPNANSNVRLTAPCLNASPSLRQNSHQR